MKVIELLDKITHAIRGRDQDVYVDCPVCGVRGVLGASTELHIREDDVIIHTATEETNDAGETAEVS